MQRVNFDTFLFNYRLVDKLYSGTRTTVYRAVSRDEADKGVIIKLLSASNPSHQDLWQLQHQYTITKYLNHPGIVRPQSFQAGQQGYALIMEDFGGISLDQYLQTHSLSVSEVLQLASQLADVLHALSQQRIIHKDIKPANILIHPVSKQVQLIDFGIASLLPRETQEILSPNLLAGTLAYLSPEQTGRMNRGIDYRTDFYTLGVTLYELLTGQLPFVAKDPLELIHCHLSQVTTPADVINPAVPAMVAQIVAKLMAKNAEDRYQSALGLKHDLEQCLLKSSAAGSISHFPLGQRDLGDRFSIPEKLYGRDAEVQILLDTFQRVATGSTEMILVAGYSGIGKTAVVNEVHKPITRQRGYFIKGKCDQFNRNLPLSVFVQAFRDLIGQLLSESDAQLAHWQNKILAAVGNSGQVLVEAIPELEQIIGAQPAVPTLTGTAAQKRFNLLFQKFIGVFATADHPFVIFLDDLQWADLASLQLIQLLMNGQSYLMLVGAYRDHEVSAIHPLLLTIAEIQDRGAIVQTITLSALQWPDTNQLIADTLHCSTQRAQPLTKLVDIKTQGNPFFTTQFLKALQADDEIFFNAAGYWECEIGRILSLALTDNVVSLMVAQLQKLPLATQELLKLAASIGNQFDLASLAITATQSLMTTATDLWPALQAGLVLPTSQVYKFWQGEVGSLIENEQSANCIYRFLHDRVQQAAYSLIPAEQKAQTHLQIGRLLLASGSQQQPSEKLFEIVHHFNAAIILITDQAERDRLAELNLRAARKAHLSTAYAAASSYGQRGQELLGEDSWSRQYPLALGLQEILAELAFLQGNFEVVPLLAQVVLDQAQTTLDQVKTYATIIQYHTIQKQYQQAIDRGLEILQKLGLKLPVKPGRLHLVPAMAKTKVALWGKSNDKLVGLPLINDPQKLAILQLADLLLTSTFFSCQELMVMLTTACMQITLQHGNHPWAASFYATYAIITSTLGDLQQSLQSGQLALLLADQFANLTVTAKVKVTVPWFSLVWQTSLRAGIPIIDAGVTAAIESGNLTYMGIGAYLALLTRLHAGISLNDIVAKMPEIEEIIVKSQDASSFNLFALERQFIANLRQTSPDPDQLFTNITDEDTLIAEWRRQGEDTLLATFYSRKFALAYLLGDIDTALKYADTFYPCRSVNTGIAQADMFDPLIRLAAYPQSTEAVKKQLMKQISDNQQLLWQRAQMMPANFQHKYDLVAAEQCRVLADFPRAIELYDQAIAGAQANGYLHEEALANELAATFYLAWGKKKVAAAYMQESYSCYEQWGAKAKMHNLAQRYPQLLAAKLQAEAHPLSTLTTITQSLATKTTNSLGADIFDFTAVIQSTQALAGIIDLPTLIYQLCQILLQNSGANTCIPILLSPPNTVATNQDQWQVYEIKDQAGQLELSCVPLASCQHLPLKLINQVRHRQQKMIWNQGVTEPSLLADEYFDRHQPQSVMCLPLLNQGELRGLVYLENRHAANIFTSDRQIVLEFIATQVVMTLHNAQLYASAQASIRERSRHEEALRAIVEGTAGKTGADFYQTCTKYLAEIFDVRYAFLTKLIDNSYTKSRMLSLWTGGGFLEPYDMDLAGTPCLATYQNTWGIFPQALQSQFPTASALASLNGESYISVVIRDYEGNIIGNLGVIDTKPLPTDTSALQFILQLFAHRVAAEMKRQADEDELRTSNERLELTNHHLERATKLKDEFLATMSHELRTPLNVILGMSEILREEILGDINEHQLNSVQAIERSGQHLLSLINDILDVSKISAGKLELELGTISVTYLCNSSLAFIKHQAFSKQLQLQVQIPSNAGNIHGDERRLRQVLINLLSNAVKFTPAGGQVTLTVTTSDGDDLPASDRQITFAVNDTGIGIAPADRSKLFQPFIQVDSSLNRKYEGTGLGLTLVKQIVELHCGTVDLTSEVGVGSCFTVRLPLGSSTGLEEIKS